MQLTSEYSVKNNLATTSSIKSATTDPPDPEHACALLATWKLTQHHDLAKFYSA